MKSIADSLTGNAEHCSRCGAECGPEPRYVFGSICCSPWCEKVILAEIAEEFEAARELMSEPSGTWFEEDIE